MRERKFVKLRVNMYDDTKLKIIDTKPERDLIHYIWNRVVVLAGKVNLEGELYLSKTIPYTIETLAIEFNRSYQQIKMAFDILIELEMLEFTEDKLYKVKNFAKHQNIKVKEKDKVYKGEINSVKSNTENIESKTKENSKEELKEQVLEEKVIINKIEEVKIPKINENPKDHKLDLKTNNNINSKVKEKIFETKEKNSLENNIPINVNNYKENISNKKKNNKSSNIIEVDNLDENETICGPIDGEYKLSPGERIIASFTFD